MITPPMLRRGDTIGIPAPAGCLTEAEIRPAIELIRSWGLHVVTGKYLFRHRNSFAGTDAQRAADFQAMLDDPSVRAVLCARGGYGTIRIIKRLNFENFMRHPKWIAGCSDITVLHAFLQQKLGMESLHSAMPRFLPPERPDLASMDSLRAALFGEVRQYGIRPHRDNRYGSARGVLVGGNLSVLYSLAGTDIEPDTAGRILFLEDVNEYLYHIDRMVMNLVLRGRLKDLKGLVVGAMNRMKVSASGFRKPAYAILREAVAGYGFPVMFGFPAGHLHPNMSLVLGREVEITVDRNQSLIRF
jgi:muramoyltetrapeptide carboxypeptidase